MSIGTTTSTCTARFSSSPQRNATRKMKVIASIEDPAVIKRSWRISTTDKARGTTLSTHHGRRRNSCCPASWIRPWAHPYARMLGLTRSRHSAARTAFDFTAARTASQTHAAHDVPPCERCPKKLPFRRQPQRPIQTPRHPLPRSTMSFIFPARQRNLWVNRKLFRLVSSLKEEIGRASCRERVLASV